MMSEDEFNNRVEAMQDDLQNIVYDTLMQYENKNQQIVSTAILGGLLNMYMKSCKITLRKNVLEKLINKIVKSDDEYKKEFRKYSAMCLINKCEEILESGN